MNNPLLSLAQHEWFDLWEPGDDETEETEGSLSEELDDEEDN